MDDNTLSLLEYYGALEWLSEEAHSEAGRWAALNLKPDLLPDEILESWRLIDEGREILIQGDSLNMGEHLDLTEVLEPLKVEGAILGVDELRAVGLEARCSRAALAFFLASAEIAPGLAALASELTSLPDLIQGIERAIGPDGEILDTASPELARIRAEIGATRQGITSRLTNLIHSDSFRHMMQDDVITTRSDRFVIPVRAGAAGGRRGLVHDWSKTGATAFLEPMEVVEDNNRLGLLKRKEKAEIERILRRLSDECRAASAELLISGAILTRLDLILAQARTARLWSATAPVYRPGGGIDLKQARHPLLMRRLAEKGGRMTPLELIIHPDKPIVIVSGLNTGGKTVAMKTLGLILALAKSGLQIPVADGSFMDFPEVYAVIGDEQDLSSDLSTFSGHVRSLGRVLETAAPGHLILLDEIGSGTDPAEGAALGLAVLEKLYGTGALVMAATHYQLIKTWAALTDGVVSAAVNSSDSGQPLYGLSYGSPGFSGGLKMARRLGLPPELVDRAEGYLDDGQRRAMELLARLDEERSRLVLTRLALEEEKLALARAEAGLRREKEELTASWAKKSQEQTRRLNEALDQTRREFEALRREMRESIADKDQKKLIGFSERKAKIENNLRAAKPQTETSDAPLASVQVGDSVTVAKLGRQAVVRAVNDKGEVWVDAGGLNVKVALGDLYAPKAETKPAGRNQMPRSREAQVTVTTSPRDGFTLELNLLGKTVDEALDAVERELDQALMNHRQTVYVVHGYGTGRLRQAVRDYLKGHPSVVGFERAPQNAGGDGVTVVTLAS